MGGKIRSFLELEGKPVIPVKEDWDIFVVCDGCRYDKFKEVNTIKGTLKKAESFVRTTPAWIQGVAQGADCSNIIYVTPLAKFDKHVPNHTFFKVVMMYKEKWNKSYDTVFPEDVTSFALNCLEEYPDKRIIVHYAQPHSPYLSVTPEEQGLFYNGETKPRLKKEYTFKEKMYKQAIKWLPSVFIWKLQKSIGTLNTGVGVLYFKRGWQGIRDAYRNDLERVIMNTKILIDKYPNKKIIISADHGELLGEYGKFGHGGIRFKKTREIPWFIVNGGKQDGSNG